MSPILEPYLSINFLEIAAALIVAAVAVRLALRVSEPSARRQAIFMASFFSMVLIVVAAQATQYLTVDDQVFVDQITRHDNRGVTQWMYGAFHSGLLILVPVARLAQGFGAASVTVHMLLKAVWLGLGAFLLLTVARQAVSLLRVERGPVSAALFIAAMLLLLPTNNLALKTVNYDLLSVTLSIISVLAAAQAMRQGRFPVGAIVIATLAAQEKLSASPILLMIIVVSAAMMAARQGGAPAERARLGVGYAAIGVLIAGGVSALSTMAFALIGPDGPLPAGYWASWSDPLASWTWVPMRFLAGSMAFLTEKMIPLCVSLLVIGASAAAASLLWPSFRRLGDWRGWEFATLTGVVVLLGLGLGGVATVNAWWAPFHPGNPEIVGRYFPLNGAVIHFDAATLSDHFRRHGLYSAAIILVSLPTSVIASFLIGAIVLLAGAWRSKMPSVVLLAFPFLLLMIGLAAAFNVPTAHRYFNVPLLGLAVLMLSVHALWSSRLSVAAATAVSGVVLLAAVIEVFPFRPSFASFRPIWVDYADAERAEPGGLNPSWMGWGEEIMLIGKQMEDACFRNGGKLSGQDCKNVTLRPFSYHGQWLPGPKGIKIEDTYRVGQDEKMTASDYYVAGRLALLQLSRIPQIPPDFVVSYRGFIQAWAWRGDRLMAAGYTTGM